MDCQSDSASADRGRIRRPSLRRCVEGAERGTAMTEFVITLPVFVILFWGIVNLGKLLREGVRVKAVASRDTWVATQDVFEQTMSVTHQYPTVAGGTAMGNIDVTAGGGGAVDMAPTAAMYKNIGLLSNGTQGEAERSQFIFNFGGDSASGSAPGSGLGSDFPGYIGDDSSWNTLSSASGIFGVFSGASVLSSIGPNQTWAAGIRYGMVQESADRDVDAFNQSFTLAAQYDVLVSPKPVKGMMGMSAGGLGADYLPVSFSRLSAEEDDCLSSVLAITKDESNDC